MSYVEEQRRHWGEKARGGFRNTIWGALSDEEYESLTQTHLAEVWPVLDEALGRRQRPTVLEVGCGEGRLTVPTSVHFPKALVVGLDATAEAISTARATARAVGVENVRFGVFGGENLPDLRELFVDLQFPERKRVHAIYSVITLQHLPQEAQLGHLGQMADLLARGGVGRVQVVDAASEAVPGPLSYPADVEACARRLEEHGVDVVSVDRGRVYEVWTWLTFKRRR